MKLFPTLEQLKHYPEWEGINSFLGIDPDSEQGKLNEKDEREDELKHMRYTDGTRVSESVDMDREVRVYCRTHGEFLLTPRLHLAGQGCPMCNRMGENKLYPTK